MAIILDDSIRVGQQKPTDDRKYNNLTPYTSVAQANSLLPLAVRYDGLTIIINSVEYWYHLGIADSNLIIKSGGGTVIPIENIGVWSPLSGYTAGNTYVSYVNSGSSDIQFQTEAIYRCDVDTIAGESPETNPEKWVYNGQNIDIVTDNTSKVYISGSDPYGQLKSIVGYTHGDNEVLSDNNVVMTFNEYAITGVTYNPLTNTYPTIIKPYDWSGSTGGWVEQCSSTKKQIYFNNATDIRANALKPTVGDDVIDKSTGYILKYTLGTYVDNDTTIIIPTNKLLNISGAFIMYSYTGTVYKNIYVDVSATGGTNVGTSWTNAYLTIDQAFSGITDYTNVWIMGGTYIFNSLITVTANNISVRGINTYSGVTPLLKSNTTTYVDLFRFSGNNILIDNFKVTDRCSSCHFSLGGTSSSQASNYNISNLYFYDINVDVNKAPIIGTILGSMYCLRNGYINNLTVDNINIADVCMVNGAITNGVCNNTRFNNININNFCHSASNGVCFGFTTLKRCFINNVRITNSNLLRTRTLVPIFGNSSAGYGNEAVLNNIIIDNCYVSSVVIYFGTTAISQSIIISNTIVKNCTSAVASYVFGEYSGLINSTITLFNCTTINNTNLTSIYSASGVVTKVIGCILREPNLITTTNSDKATFDSCYISTGSTYSATVTNCVVGNDPAFIASPDDLRLKSSSLAKNISSVAKILPYLRYPEQWYDSNNKRLPSNLLSAGACQDIVYLQEITGGSTNLSQSSTSTNLTIFSDTGTDVILSGATASNSGLLISSDKTKLDSLNNFTGGTSDQITNNSVLVIGTTVTNALDTIHTDLTYNVLRISNSNLPDIEDGVNYKKVVQTENGDLALVPETTITTVDNAAAYNPLTIYNKVGTIVSYVNTGSTDPQFQTLQLYSVSVAMSVAGIDPETSPYDPVLLTGNWSYMGLEVQNTVDNTSKTFITGLDPVGQLRNIKGYKDGDNMANLDYRNVRVFDSLAVIGSVYDPANHIYREVHKPFDWTDPLKGGWVEIASLDNNKKFYNDAADIRYNARNFTVGGDIVNLAANSIMRLVLGTAVDNGTTIIVPQFALYGSPCYFQFLATIGGSLPDTIPAKSILFSDDKLASATTTREVFYDTVNRCLAINLGNGVIQQLGQEQTDVLINNSGAPMTNGTLVRITDYDLATGHFIVSISSNASEATAYVDYMLTETINNGNSGIGTKIGLVHELATTGGTIGNAAYLSTNGGFQNTAPTYPAKAVVIGQYGYIHASIGVIDVCINRSTQYTTNDLQAQIDLKAMQNPGICQMCPILPIDIVINPTGNTLTIATVKGGQTISASNPLRFFTDGNGIINKWEFTSPIVFNFTSTSGIWYFHIDNTGTPIGTQVAWSDINVIATVYRFLINNTLSDAEKVVVRAWECHLNNISAADHAWKHAKGSINLNGFDYLANILTSTNGIPASSPDADGRNTVFSLLVGSNSDDGLEYTVIHSTTPTAKFNQNLGLQTTTGLNATNSALFKIRTNDNLGRVSFLPATRFPFPFSSSTNIPQYITELGVRIEVASLRWMVVYAYSLQDDKAGEAIKIAPANLEFTSYTTAQAHNWVNLQAIYPTLRDKEVRPLWKAIYYVKYTTGNSYPVGCKYSALIGLTDLRNDTYGTYTGISTSQVVESNVITTPLSGFTQTNQGERNIAYASEILLKATKITIDTTAWNVSATTFTLSPIVRYDFGATNVCVTAVTWSTTAMIDATEDCEYWFKIKLGTGGYSHTFPVGYTFALNNDNVDAPGVYEFHIKRSVIYIRRNI